MIKIHYIHDDSVEQEIKMCYLSTMKQTFPESKFYKDHLFSRCKVFSNDI